MGKTQHKTPTEAASAPAGSAWLLLLLPLLALVASLTLSYLWNEDFWWYVTSGRAVLDNGGIPEADPFLYTSGQGIGWVHHSWLWTVVVALLEGAGGLGTVVVFHALLASALVVLLYTTARVDRWGLANALAVLLFLVTIRHRLCGKAELATLLLLVVFYRLLEWRRAGGAQVEGGAGGALTAGRAKGAGTEDWTWRHWVALGVLQVLWANLHGGYPLGIFLALCYCVGPWLQERFAPKSFDSSKPRPPLWLPVALFLLAVADPRLFKERLAPFGFVTGSETVQPMSESGSMLIIEWLSPFSPRIEDPSLPWLFAAAALAGLASFAVVRRRSWPRMLFFLGMAALGASAVRHLGVFALATALVVISNLAQRAAAKRAEPQPRKRRKSGPPAPRRPWLYPAACALLALFLLASAVSLRLAVPGFEGGQDGRFFTTKPAIVSPGAADYILEHDLPAPIFNDYQLGAYLSYRLFPHYRLFVDSRVLDPSVVVEYTKVTASESEWRRFEKKYGFQTVVLGNYSRTVRSPLGLALLQDPTWRLVYVDPLAVVYTRDQAAPPADDRLRVSDGEASRVPFTDPPGFGAWLAGLQRVFVNDFPANYLIEYLATLGQLGRVREVREMATEALATMPDHPLLYRQRCAAEVALKDLEAAVGDCAKAYELLPTDSQVTTLYCTVLNQAGRSKEARYILDEALRRDPEDRRLKALRRRFSR